MAMSDAAASTQNLPWVEKYRPKSINEIAHQEEVVSTLRRAVATGASRGDLPHLLLYGPPGTGKTSTALALARDLFGAHNLRARVLELNASDERGIRAVRDRIKAFAATTPAAITTSGAGTTGTPRSPPPFKLVILDEADAITADAQTALRRTIEAHSKGTRFILICNYVSRIIAPLTSRCAKFRFAPLPRHAMIAHLKHIAAAEKLAIEESFLEHLVDESAGDLRAAITTLQSAARMSVNAHSSVSEQDIAAAGCALPNPIVEKFDLETSNVSGDARNRAVRLVVDDIVRQGFSAQQLLIQYAEKLLATPSSANKGAAAMNNLQKAAVAKVIAEAEHRLIDGSDEKVQMYDVACRILAIAKNPNDANTLRTI